MPASHQLSSGSVAKLLGVEPWRIRRLFETGTVQEPDRLAGRRVIPCAMVPRIITALRDRSWLPQGDADDAAGGVDPIHAEAAT